MAKTTENGITWDFSHRSRIGDLNYADDVCLMTHTNIEMKNTLKRIEEKVRLSFYRFNNVWNSFYLKRITKLRIFNSNVKSVLLLGTETLKLSKDIIKKVQTFINKCLLKIGGILPERHWSGTHKERENGDAPNTPGVVPSYKKQKDADKHGGK